MNSNCGTAILMFVGLVVLIFAVLAGCMGVLGSVSGHSASASTTFDSPPLPPPPCHCGIPTNAAQCCDTQCAPCGEAGFYWLTTFTSPLSVPPHYDIYLPIIGG